MKFLLIIWLAQPVGDVNAYVEADGLTWYGCEVSGVVFESFNPNANWFCEVEE